MVYSKSYNHDYVGISPVIAKMLKEHDEQLLKKEGINLGDMKNEDLIKRIPHLKSVEVIKEPQNTLSLSLLKKQEPKVGSFFQKCADLFFEIIEAIKDFFIRLFGPAPINPSTEINLREENSKLEKVDVSVISRLESKLVNPNPKHSLKLTLELLKASESLPKYTMKYDNATYYFSDAFMHHGNIARIMYVEIDGEVHPRVIYQSNSQAVWRVMPLLSKGYNHHIGKGKIESDTQLPLEVNLALHTLSGGKTPTVKLDSFAENLVKTEMGGNIFANKMQHESWNEKVAIKSFIDLHTDAPKMFMKKGMFVPKPPNPKDVKAPQDPGQLPDFSKPLKETKIEVAHYGKLKAKIFPSKDNSIRYLFYEASDGRAFIGGIEKITGNPINKFGVREECPEGNNMDAPLLEYYEQIPKEYDPGFNAPSYISNKYRNNWNYVRELPLIQLYYAEQGKTIPGKV